MHGFMDSVISIGVLAVVVVVTVLVLIFKKK